MMNLLENLLSNVINTHALLFSFPILLLNLACPQYPKSNADIQEKLSQI